MPQAYYADRIAPGSARSRTPEGYLVITGVPIARTGYQVYQASELGEPGSGAIRVYRSPEEVFDVATIASFEGKSITTPHPPTFLTPHNDASYYKGHVQKIRKGGKLADGETALLADLIIKDAQLINQLDNGSIAEVSAGYQCEYEAMPDGNYKQLNIRGNHVAIVPAGRCGPACRVNDCKGSCNESAKEVTPMEGMQDVEKTLSVFGNLENFFIKRGWKKPPAQANDAEPGPVELNLQAAEVAKANQRRIALDKEKEEEEKMAAKDAEEREKEKKESEDRAKAQDAKMEKLQSTLDALLAKDKKDDEDEPDKEMEDELIPIHALSGEEIPKNPIPGADAKKMVDALRVIKPLVAKSKDAVKMKAFNDAFSIAYKASKVTEDEGESTEDTYARLHRASERTQDQMHVVKTGEEKVLEAQNNFMTMTAKHHRRNPQEINAAAQGGK